MKKSKILLAVVLGICFMFAGCASDKQVISADSTFKIEEGNKAEMFYFDKEALNADGCLYWMQESREGDIYSLFYCVYDLKSKELFKKKIDSDNSVYLIPSNYPEGAIVVEHSGEEQFEFWTVLEDKQPQTQRTVKISNGSLITAIYNGDVYYRDNNANFKRLSLKNGKVVSYDKNIFEDIAVSTDGKMIFLNRIVTKHEFDEYYYPDVYELCLVKLDKSWQKISLPEDCLIDSSLSAQGAWIDEKQAILALQVKNDKAIEMCLYQFDAETNQLVKCCMQDGNAIVLCEGKNNIVDDSITVSPDGMHVAYLVYDIGNMSSQKSVDSFSKGAEERTYIVVASLETGEKYLISDIDFAPGDDSVVYAPLLWRN